MPVPRDSPCPKRGPGLTHVVDGSTICLHCGAMTSRSVYDMIAGIRSQYLTEQEQEAQEPKDMPPPEPPKPGLCGWGRVHKADAVYPAYRLGIYICKRHLDQALTEVFRRGDWMK